MVTMQYTFPTLSVSPFPSFIPNPAKSMKRRIYRTGQRPHGAESGGPVLVLRKDLDFSPPSRSPALILTFQVEKMKRL